jgi:transposase
MTIVTEQAAPTNECGPDWDAVVGVDTHADTHTAAICDARGGVLHVVSVPADSDGYADLLDAVAQHTPGPAVLWAVEGSGSYGAGLTAALRECGQQVTEVRTATRARGQAKTDRADAVAIARAAAITDRPAQPRRGTVREALRVLLVAREANVNTRTAAINRLKGLVITAPEPIRAKLRIHTGRAQVQAAARLRVPRQADVATIESVAVLRAIAGQIRELDKAIAALDTRLGALTRQHAQPLLDEPGVGPISAARLLVAWSHHDRFPHEAAFAALAGVSPLEASSGKTTRHRLNRSGDRQLNAAIHRVALTRRRCHHPETEAYVARRTTEGKTDRDIHRCLKRYLARRLFRILQSLPALP